MIQTISMTQVLCDHKDHQGKQITCLCNRSQRNEKSAGCQQYQQEFHRECLDHLFFFDEIPKLVGTFSTLETVYQNLVSSVNLVLQQVQKALDGLLSPIKMYQDSQNLGNLNQLGELLRVNPKYLISQLIEVEVIKLLESIQTFEQKILNLEPSQSQIDKAEKLSEEYQGLWRRSKYQELH